GQRGAVEVFFRQGRERGVAAGSQLRQAGVPVALQEALELAHRQARLRVARGLSQRLDGGFESPVLLGAFVAVIVFGLRQLRRKGVVQRLGSRPGGGDRAGRHGVVVGPAGVLSQRQGGVEQVLPGRQERGGAGQRVQRRHPLFEGVDGKPLAQLLRGV